MMGAKETGTDMQVLILPGLDGQAALRAEFIAALAPSLPARCLTYPDHLSRYDDLLPLIQDQVKETEGNFILIAESFSGPLALRIAETPPAGLKGIIWVGSFISAPSRLPVCVAHMARFTPVQHRPFRQLMNFAGFGSYGTKETRKLCAEIMQNLPPKTIAGRLKEVLSLSKAPEHAQSTLPALALCASRDRLLNQHSQQAFEDHGIPTELVTGPHFLLQSRPVEIATRVRRFFDTL